MNKDVIKVTPEDDIADIISGIKKSTQKIIAIVPPTPSGVLRSAVNIKLILKASSEAKKIPVLITTDPVLLKFATKFNLHVADSLQSKPYIPADSDIENTSSATDSESVTEDFLKPSDGIPEAILSEAHENSNSDQSDSDEDVPENNSDSDSSVIVEEKDPEKKKLPSNFSKKFPWISSHIKLVVIGFVALMGIAAFFVWAITVAPAVGIKVVVKTSSSNFSESVSFTKDSLSEDSKSGKFFLQDEKGSDEQKYEFKATGSKDIGEKSKGTLVVSTRFDVTIGEDKVSIPANSQFVYGGRSYLAAENYSIKWNGLADIAKCENGSISDIGLGCLITKTIEVVAAEPGADYDLPEGKNDWSSPSVKGLSNIYNNTPISGGSTKVVTVVSQSDVDNARGKIAESVTESEGRTRLMSKISDTMLVINDTFEYSAGEIECNVQVDEQVPDGVVPAVSQKTEYSISVIDKVRLEEFITAKATLAADQKIYSVGDPFVEYFNKNGDSYTAKLKTTYKVGPKVTESEILEKSKGRKIGEVQSLLKSINGVGSVNITPSYFWVSSVPTDPNKISIELTIED